MERVTLITGSESPLGRTLADYLFRAGHHVFRLDTSRLVARSAGEGEGPDGPPADADAFGTAEAAVADYVAHVVNRAGRLDAVVNVAGYGLAGAVETTTAGELADLYAHNLLLPHAATRAALSVMGVQGHGALINVGVFPPDDARAGLGLYAASLHALLTYTETLRRELAPEGVATRFVQARSPGGLGPDVRWSRLLALPSFRALRDAFRRLAGDPPLPQAHARLAHLIEGMIRDPRPVRLPLPDHALPPSVRAQVLPRTAAPGVEVDEGPADGARRTRRTERAEDGPGDGRPDTPFAPPWVTFLGPWDGPEKQLVARALKGYEAEADVPDPFDPYWVCHKSADAPPRVTAHRAGSLLLVEAPDAAALARGLRLPDAHAPDRPY